VELRGRGGALRALREVVRDEAIVVDPWGDTDTADEQLSLSEGGGGVPEQEEAAAVGAGAGAGGAEAEARARARAGLAERCAEPVWQGMWVNDVREQPLCAAALALQSARKRQRLEARNVGFVEVLHRGWPCVFLVTSRGVLEGEELLLDLGGAFMESHRWVWRCGGACVRRCACGACRLCGVRFGGCAVVLRCVRCGSMAVHGVRIHSAQC
jgi:hypothetical protein